MKQTVRNTLLAIVTFSCIVAALRGSGLAIPSGTWQQTGNLSAQRAGASAALLQDGRILVTGGTGASGALPSADFFNPDGTVSPAPPMFNARAGHVSVTLQDGRVLVAGGVSAGGSATSTAEIFDPVANSWSFIGAGMTEARSGATAALLQDGRVLIAGGQNGTLISSTVEIFDPSTGAFSAAGMMSSPRTQQAMTPLHDGRVLIVGGYNGTAPVASTDIFDPVAGTISAGPSLSVARFGHSATTLINGIVAVIGGNNGNADPTQVDVTPTEIFDPSAVRPAFTTITASLTTPREGHLAIALPNNNSVLIVGGTSAGAAVASAELFMPQVSSTGAWTYSFAPAGTMSAARSAAAGSANQVNAPSTTMQRNGTVAVAGGNDATGNALNTTEAYGYATVQTDQNDYAPGTTVTITGSGFQPGETVNLQLVESPLIDTPGPFSAIADANGNIANTQFVPDAYDVNVRFYLTATGATSGFVAQSTFTDATGTNTGISSNENPSVGGDSVTFTATVTESGQGGGTAGSAVTAGTVDFRIGGNNCNQGQGTVFASGVTLNSSGQASAADTFTTAGSVTVRACYNAAAGFQNSNGALTQTVNANAPTTVTLNSVSPNSVSYGSTGLVTFTATLIRSAGDPLAGAPVVGALINFTVDNVAAGSAVTNSSGVATYSTYNPSALSVASHSVQASFAAATVGGVSYLGNASGTLPLTINKADQTITFSALGDKTYGDAPFTVSATGGASGNPVTFSSTTTGICTTSGTNGSTVTLVAAGSCSIKASQAGNGNYNAATDVVQSFAVNKATPTVAVAFTPNSLTYDGNSHPAAATVTGVGGADITSGHGTVSITYTPGASSAPVNAGSYTASAHFASTDGNYNDADSSTSASLTINKANATVVVTPYTVTYDGHAHTASVTSITGVNGETGATVGTVDVSNTSHTNAATYSGDTWSFTGTANYNNIAATTITDTINKANAVVVVAPYTVTYDGHAHTAAITSITGVNGETGATVGTVTLNTTHTNAGTYASDSWSFAGGSNYNDIAATTITDTINKANAVVAVTPYTVTYDGNPHTAAGTAKGVESPTPADLSSLLHLDGTTHTNAGDYPSDGWTFDGNTNYNSTSGTVHDHIDKANAVISVAPYSVTYDGNPHTATGTATGVKGEALSGLDLSGTTHTNAGSYTDTWTFTDSTGNYNNATGTASDSIAKANAVISVTPYSVTYDGNAHTATGTATGVKGEALTGLDLSGTTHTMAGTFATDPWTFTDSTGNYNNASGTVSDSIAKANAVISVTPYSVTYDGNAHTASGTATGVKGESLAGLNLSGTTHTAAGSYSSDPWSFTDTTGNYNNANGSVSDSIAKANATISVTPYNVTYDGNAHTATGTATGVKGEALTGLDLSGTTHTNAGSYIDTWTFTDVTGNYNNASGTASDSIAKAPGSVSISDIPVHAILGGSFTPTLTVLGDGSTSVASETPGTCTVTGGLVSFLAVGTCTLQASVTAGTNYLPATGAPQSFTIGYNFAGLFSPYAPPPTAYKINSAIPLSWQYTNVGGVVVVSSSASPTVNIYYAAGSCTDTPATQVLDVTAAGNSGYQYNTTTNTWQFNWKTTGMTSGCYVIQVSSGLTGQVSPSFLVQLTNH